MKLTVAAAALLCVSTFAGEPAESLVQNSGFEKGTKPWIIASGTKAEIKPGCGKNQSHGLQVTVAANRRGVVLQKIRGFKRNVKYIVTCWIKADANASGSMTMDVFTKSGKYVPGHGFYHGAAVCNKDWTLYKDSYVHKGEDPEQHNYHLVLLSYYVKQRRGGEVSSKPEGCVYYDDVMIVEDVPAWLLTQIYPVNNAISEKGGDLILSNFCDKGFIPEKTEPLVLAEIKYPGKAEKIKVPAKYQGNRITVTVPAAKPGPSTLQITLSAPKTKKIYGTKILPVTIRKETAAPENACLIDRQGRAIVNGKPFMPLGVYCNLGKDGMTPAFLNMLDKIGKDHIFNCFMAYGIQFHLKSDAELVRFFDEAQKRDLKVMAGISDFLHSGAIGSMRTRAANAEELDKRVSRFTDLVKRHPATLAYYIDDETPVGELGQTKIGRQMLNRHDPFHPTWGVSYQVETFQHYIPAVDVFAFDVYPVVKGGSNFSVRWMAKSARNVSDYVWAIPQCYQKDSTLLTVENMFSPCAVEIIYGVKGFIFWSVGPSKFDKGDMNKRWPILYTVGRTLKQLEPFILSDIPGKKLQVKNAKEEVEAVLLNDGKGNYRIVAAGIFHHHQSDILIPKDLKLISSQFSHLKETAPGVLRYEGGALTADVGVLVRR